MTKMRWKFSDRLKYELLKKKKKKKSEFDILIIVNT